MLSLICAPTNLGFRIPLDRKLNVQIFGMSCRVERASEQQDMLPEICHDNQFDDTNAWRET